MSAGAGKSEAICLDQLQHVNDPNYESITFRRTTKSLVGAGGIFSKYEKLYSKLGAKSNKNDLMHTFPSGAKSRCSHLELGVSTAERDHAGLEYSKIYFDELQTFPRDAFMFFLSRMRSNADMKSQIKATLNPPAAGGDGEWIYDFLKDFYIDDHGYPILENSGRTRYFITDPDGNVIVGDSVDELHARHGLDCQPISYTFIPALIADNPVLCKKQPNYLRALKNLPRVERERLLYACWKAVPEGSTYFKRNWCAFINYKELPKMKKVIRAWDLASSEPSEINPKPDKTACVKIGLGVDGNYYILHAEAFYGRPSVVMEKIKQYAELDGKGVKIGIPLDPSAAGKVAFRHYSSPLIAKGYKVKRLQTRKGKLERFIGFSNAAENGFVVIVRGEWNNEYLNVLENFDPNKKKGVDDLVDATSDAYNSVVDNSKTEIRKPSFSLSGLIRVNEFAAKG